jgi:hypothetical protein
MRVTPGEIKTKTPRIARIPGIYQKTLDQVLGPPVRYDGGWNALGKTLRNGPWLLFVLQRLNRGDV